MPESIKGKKCAWTGKGKKGLTTYLTMIQFNRKTAPPGINLYSLLKSMLATSGLMALIHQLDFEVTTQQSFGFLFSDYQAVKPLKLPISSGKKKKIKKKSVFSARPLVFLCVQISD